MSEKTTYKGRLGAWLVICWVGWAFLGVFGTVAILMGSATAGVLMILVAWILFTAAIWMMIAVAVPTKKESDDHDRAQMQDAAIRDAQYRKLSKS